MVRMHLIVMARKETHDEECCYQLTGRIALALIRYRSPMNGQWHVSSKTAVLDNGMSSYIAHCVAVLLWMSQIFNLYAVCLVAFDTTIIYPMHTQQIRTSFMNGIKLFSLLNDGALNFIYIIVFFFGDGN